jgi:hypothetical protein
MIANVLFPRGLLPLPIGYCSGQGISQLDQAPSLFLSPSVNSIFQLFQLPTHAFGKSFIMKGKPSWPTP